LGYLTEVLAGLDREHIAAFAAELESTRMRENTVFLAGNGGSAATANHMSNDLGVDVQRKGQADPPYRVHSLTTNIPIMTALSNDVSYDAVFVEQLKMSYREGDLLVAISASGNSPNVVNAAEWVRERGGRVAGLLGFDGGKLLSLCDVYVLAETPKGEFGPVEDVHMIIDHLLGSFLQHAVRPR
jgi:D-sedoheptulose 7-phosphate isomerase